MATVAGTPFEFDDLLDAGGASWRRRLIALGAVTVIVAAAAFFAWNQWWRGGTSTVAPVFTEATVTTGNVTKTISTSGTVSAAATSNLNFTSAQKVTRVNVTVGQAVKQGDVLAEIDPTDANNALTTVQASLASAQANLQQVLQGSTAAQLASADQSVVQAQNSYNTAISAQQTLLQPPTASALGTAQQAITAAQAQLLTAREARANLTTGAETAVETAQNNVQKAQLAANTAEQALTNASQNKQVARGTLTNAESAYCADPDPANPASFCTAQAVPISTADANVMVTVSGGADATRASRAQAVLTADSSYRNAASAYETASNSVTTTENDLAAAQSALTTAEGQPTDAQVASADSAVSAAEAALATATYNLSELQAGPTQAQIASAQGTVDQAAAGLKSARVSRDTVYAGSTNVQIQQARTTVQQAQISVANAQKVVDDTKLTAPFDGTVAALNTQVGDIASAGGGSSTASSAAIVLNTPNRLTLALTIAETDYPSVKAGNTGTATFSALSGEIFPFVIDSVGANPTTTQGVVTYQARAHLATGQEAAQILASLRTGGTDGANAPGAIASGTPGTDTTAPAGRTPRAGRTPGANGAAGAAPAFGNGFGQALANQTQPAPGMSATVTIIVEQKTGVIIVPSRAVQTKNRATVVTVKNADGTTEDVAVTAGLSDGTNTEITNGLADGQTIEVPGATTTTTATQSLPATGGLGGGGFGGGGGGFPGPPGG